MIWYAGTEWQGSVLSLRETSRDGLPIHSLTGAVVAEVEIAGFPAKNPMYDQYGRELVAARPCVHPILPHRFVQKSNRAYRIQK
jgi:hypothetical protein